MNTTHRQAHELGLRERTKAKRRKLLLHTALRLFAERGYDNVTIADIADEAELAPRTVTAYFPAKLDFVTATSEGIVERFLSLSNEHPDIGFLELMDRWLCDLRDNHDLEEAALLLAMERANAGIAAMGDVQVAERMSARDLSLTTYTGRSPDDPIQVAAREAVRGVVTTYLRTLGEKGMTVGVHVALMGIIRTVADLAKVD